MTRPGLLLTRANRAFCSSALPRVHRLLAEPGRLQELPRRQDAGAIGLGQPRRSRSGTDRQAVARPPPPIRPLRLPQVLGLPVRGAACLLTRTIWKRPSPPASSAPSPGPSPPAGDPGDIRCFRQGTFFTYSQAAFVTALGQLQTAGVRNFVVYVEYRSGTPTQNNFPWDGSVWGCNLDPALSRSVLVDVRNGGFSDIGAGGDMINGAIFTDGDFNTTGKMTFNGTINVGGTASFGGSSDSSRWMRAGCRTSHHLLEGAAGSMERSRPLGRDSFLCP